MSESPGTNGDPTAKGRILLIEDDRSVLNAIKRLLSREGYKVVDFDHPKDAVKKETADSGSFDLMIIDINLPEMDGFDVSLRLKEIPSHSETPIIFISAIHTSSEEMNRGLSLGAVDYIIKPFDPDIFLRKVENFVTLKKNEERVRALKMRYQLLFEKYNDPTLILDPAGLILEVNDAAREILGITPRIKIPFYDLVYDEDEKEARRLIDTLISSGGPQDPKVIRIKDRSGSFIFTEINGGLFFDRRGSESTPDSIHITLRDITDRITLTRNLGLLLDTSRRLSGTLTLDTIFTILTESIEKAVLASRIGVIYLSPEREATLMATTGPLSKRGRKNISLPYPIDLDDYPEFRLAMEKKGPIIIEDTQEDDAVSDVRNVLKKVGVMSILVIPIVMGEMTYGFINLAEIGDYRRFAKEEVEVLKTTADLAALSIKNALLFDETKRNEEFKSHLINVFTHEVGTPLGTIIGHTQILMEGMSEGEKRLKNLKTIYGETDRLNSLMESFLDITRLRSGKLAPRIERVKPGVIASKLFNDFKGRFTEKGITPFLEMGDKNMGIDADLLLVEGAVTNLLSNSLKYTPPGGKVTLSLKSYDSPPNGLKRSDAARLANRSLVSFSVTDTGIGVPAGDGDKIFEEFYRSENVPDDEKGAGLGLTFVKEVAEIHNGAVKFTDNKSEGGGDGGGSTFEIILPGRK